MTTNDHTVPQMYLKRFADQHGKKFRIVVHPVADQGKPFDTTVKSVVAVKGFYWGVDEDDTQFHDAEQLFCLIEAEATPIFATILDDPIYALTRQWPLPDGDRLIIAWWMAAQLLRTTRQRKRLEHQIGQQGSEPSPAVRSMANNNIHLAFIASHIAAVAHTIYQRPWGLGFSDACLTTGDTPVVILNGHDADNQLLSIAFWDIVFPLDPHRLLILPGSVGQDDPRKRRDHRLKLDGGLGVFINQVIFDAADRFVIYHPKHKPLAPTLRLDGPRLATPWKGEERSSPQYSMSYETLHPDFTVERRWLTQHPPALEGFDRDRPRPHVNADLAGIGDNRRRAL